MKVELSLFESNNFTKKKSSPQFVASETQLVLAFGAKDVLNENFLFQKLSGIYENSEIIICSTSGEIYNNEVHDNTVSVCALQFEKSIIKTHSVSINSFDSSYMAGLTLAHKIDLNQLCYILIISDGSNVNGSELVRGLNDVIPHEIPITGGLAGDADKFTNTLVGLNEEPADGRIVAAAFYGNNLKVGHASMGGWDTFGPERKVTKSKDNILFEIEGKNALDDYKHYLGSYASQLPASALLFPLSLKIKNSDQPVVRTILNINEEEGYMVFAGDIPQGATIRFMKANFDRLIDAATNAAILTRFEKLEDEPTFALLISCVGRKLILENRTEEEVEAVYDEFKGNAMLSGFYSYGEISPFNTNSNCQLHNQTMTITTFFET